MFIKSRSITREVEWAEIKGFLSGSRFWRTLLSMAVGIPIFAVAINGLVVPHHLFTGGLTGISLILYYLAPGWGLGLLYFLLNIPMFMLGWKKTSLQFLFISALGMIYSALAFELTEGLVLPVKDPLMTGVMAGILAGLGNGIYFRFGGSAGGLDILATFLRRAFAIPVGTTFNVFNFSVLAIAFILNDVETSFYSGLFIYFNAFAVEKVQSGFSQRSAVLIVTEQPAKVAHEIMRRLDRGVTFLQSSGGYSHLETQMIYTVINMTEAGRLKDLIYESDPNALLTILATSSVIGKKFLTWEDEGYSPPRMPGAPPEI